MYEAFDNLIGGIFRQILAKIDEYVALQMSQDNERVTDLVSRKMLASELGISIETLKNWERLGLRSYQPPVSNTPSVFYRLGDVYKFLSTEETDESEKRNQPSAG